MNILVVNWQDIKNPQAGGAEVHLHEVFERIAAKGHRVTLACSTFPGAASEESLNGIRVIRRGGRFLFNFRFVFEYLTRFRKDRYDIVVDDMNKIPFFTPLFVREPIYGVTHHLFGKSIFLETNLLLASYVYGMEQAAVALYKNRRIPFIVGSPSTERELKQAGFSAEEVSLIHYGVDHSTHHLKGAVKSPTPLIGYFGRLKKYKSVDHFLLSLPVVMNHVPNLKAVIVGEGDDRPRLEAMARQLGLSKAVEFTGFVSEERKIALLQHMWLKVTTSSKEGWGLTVIEANACGTPVVASNVEGLRDAVQNGKTGLLYEFGNVADLSSKMLQLLTDEALRRRLASNAVEWSKKFDWDHAAEETLGLLRKRLVSR
ncbi:MAG: glycosyltransferase family 4 protein [Bacteroidetes bacterium]|nr:glycosyltransferase family 4 protein [Bacteroidota bacterium]MCW5895294.1 glycosyltransferase family 4 protein [Bacteroidota bacterium]